MRRKIALNSPGIWGMSAKVVDLETFVPRGDIDAVYFDSPYYLYPDGPIAVEALRVMQ
jgi:DNA end-binding protein Ku